MEDDLAAPQHYVADSVDLSESYEPSLLEVEAAANQIRRYLQRRVTAVLSKFPTKPIIMLSGGIDSVLLASVVAKQAPDVLAVTFVHSNSESSRIELETARAVAEELGLKHILVDPNPQEALELLREATRRLDTCDPWEVLAGVTLLACVRAADAEGYDGAIFTGAGADALFLGGFNFSDDVDISGTWQQTVRAKVEKNFTRHRQIPDFYERLLDDRGPDSERHIQVWQTHQAFELAMSMAASAVRGGDLQTDKLVMREAALRAGLPQNLVMNTKNPMQVSSGGIDMIVDAARELLAGNGGHTAYTNPKTESVDFIASRLMLELLHSQS
ncbi:asparagine synthase C-terminal domain-containing protein [Corynebacterium pseudopelargi]|uniref:Asparagine synthetase B n=1 Tax=Corynebacterium pseudopelargi TaxID=2080757 RepID=A0A3G6IRL1_9CORY|nr:asparagine synthase C-terminal domain-containing protein [Corynebacterium pseudopelargi]AZA08222.1 asparagine synthetase B [Corynebacterium pseudopelargi]